MTFIWCKNKEYYYILRNNDNVICGQHHMTLLCSHVMFLTLPLLICPPPASACWPCSPASSWPPSLSPAPTNAERRGHMTRGAAARCFQTHVLEDVDDKRASSVSSYQRSLSGLPLGLGQQLLYALQRVLQDVHLEQQSLSLDLQPTQLLHHLVVAGLQLQLRHRHSYRSVWDILEQHVTGSGRTSVSVSPHDNPSICSITD